MLKHFNVLCSVISKAMSKKCKVDFAKKSSNFTEVASKETYLHTLIDRSQTTSGEHSIYKILRLSPPIKSENDKKEYAVIRLENGLGALLISDVASQSEEVEIDEGLHSSGSSEDESDNEVSDGSLAEELAECKGQEKTVPRKDEKLAACSLTVAVGSFSDPNDIPGLAHFLEHMVFMGSKKYPKENEFDSYIKRHGGSDNASTECELSTFYFECHDKYLPKAMDIFSQFFISPLMKREAMTREREAIESEFTIALPSDVFKRQQLLSTTAVPGNPGGKFLWGNLKTLRDDVTDDYLYKSVHNFWQRHYTAHRMTLAVQARVPLETLEKWVIKYFAKVPCNYLPPLPYKEPKTLFDMEKFHKLYFVESVNDNIMVELNWHLPPVRHLYKSKPTNYLSWIIGHEGKHSLISYLRKKLWALELSAGHNEDALSNNSIYSLFTISVSLTEEGFKHSDDVLNAIFSYIKMLQIKGPEQRIFLELQKIAEINFRYDEESPAVENVEFLSENMHIYPPTHFITGNELLFEYNPDEIMKFLNRLSPSTVNLILSKKHHDPSIHFDNLEPWFKTQYTYKDISDSLVQNWTTIKPYNEFKLPEPNNFIASDFTLLHHEKETPKYPEKIFSSDTLSLWYKPDTKFKLPLGSISFQIINNKAADSILMHTIFSLYVDILNHFLVEELYPANMALLQYCVVLSGKALLIEVYGFNEKLYVLLEKISEYIIKFSDIVTEDLLNTYKEKNAKEYYNRNLNIQQLCREIRLSLLLNEFYTSSGTYNCLPGVTIDLLKKFSKELFSEVHIQCLVQGNILKEQALEICTKFVNQFNPSGLPLEERQKLLVYKLPNEEKCCRIQSFNTTDSNCITTNYYQFGIGKVKEHCIIDLLIMLIEEPLFDQLRTQEQLGYDVSCTLREVEGVLGFSISVVSQIDKHTIDHVEERITAFLYKYLEDFKQMPISDFNEVVQSLINLKQCCDLHIKEEIKRNWSEIKTFEYAFDRLERETKFLATLKPEDVVEFLEKIISPGSPDYRKLTVQIAGHIPIIVEDNIITKDSDHLPLVLKYSYINESSRNKTNYLITSINDFNSQLPLFPENKVFDT